MLKNDYRRIGAGAVSLTLAAALLLPAGAASSAPFLPPLPGGFAEAPGVTPKWGGDAGDLGEAFKAMLAEMPAAKNHVPHTDSSAPIKVIVELRSEPARVVEQSAGKSFSPSLQRNKLRAEHAAFKLAAARLGAAAGSEFTEVFNGYALTLPGNQVDKLLDLPGVKAVYPDEAVQAAPISAEPLAGPSPVIASGDLIGADSLIDQGITGEGVKVAVLDTGIDYNHPLVKDRYAGGYDLVDEDDDPYETDNPDHIPPDADGTPYETAHGTHVAGIVAGVAPGAEIYAYRVLGPYGSGSTEQTLAGIERAAADGADVINMSLGSGFNQSYAPDAIAADNAVKAGITVVIAAGNTGEEGSYTLTTPGGAHRAITVGASTKPVVTPVIHIGDAEPIYGLRAFLSPELTEEESDVRIVYAGAGSAADFDNINVQGDFVLVDRGGGLDFSAKSLNATKAGAAALLIANNETEPVRPSLSRAGDYIPTYGITLAEGKALKQELVNGEGTLSYELIDEPERLADFSSRGPGLPDFIIKPEMIAPGVDILSSVPVWAGMDGTYDTAYAEEEGTSMAAPHIAGAAALLLQAGEDMLQEPLDPEQIKSMLMNSAEPLTDRNGFEYGYFEQGAGLPHLDRVMQSPVIAKVFEQLDLGIPGLEPESYYTGSLSYGIQNRNSTVTKTVYLDNLSGAPLDYQAEIEWYTKHAGLNAYLSDETLELPAEGGSFEVTLSIGDNARDGFYEGAVKLTGTEGQTLFLPLAAVLGDKLKPDAVDSANVYDLIFSPDGDGLSDMNGLYFSVNERVTDLNFEVSRFDFNTGDGEVVGDIHGLGGDYAKGRYEAAWDGRVYDSGTGELEPLEDGFYIVTPVYGEERIRLDEQRFSFAVDTGAPLLSSIMLDEVEPRDGERQAVLYGDIMDDLLLELITGTDGYEMEDLFGISAVYEGEDGAAQQADGVLYPDGYFEIEVLLREGMNDFYIYAYDIAGNGAADEDYAQLLKYSTGADAITVSPALSAANVTTGQPVTVDVRFTAAESVYGAMMSLAYDGRLQAPVIQPSVQLATYQEAHDPGVPLAEYTDSFGISGGRQVVRYGVQLTNSVYSGEGSVASFTFVPAEAGIYTFELGDLLFWNEGRTFTAAAGLARAQLTVTDPAEPETQQPGQPGSQPNPAPGTPVPVTPEPLTANTSSVRSGTLTANASGASALSSAVVAVSDTALNQAVLQAQSAYAVLSLSDLLFADYSFIRLSLTSAQADKLKSSGVGLMLEGREFTLSIPAESLADFAGTQGLSVELSLDPDPGVLTIKGPAAVSNAPAVGVKNGWTSGTPVILRLPLNANTGDDRKIGAYEKAADGSWTYLQSGKLVKDGSLELEVRSDGTYTAAAGTGTFRDLAGHWAKDDIEVLAAHQLVAGKGTAGLFSPNDTVNRAELLTLLDRLQGKGDTWLTHIREQDARRPLTRQEAATLAAAALKNGGAGSDVSLPFADSHFIAPDDRAAVAYMFEQGYMKGEGLFFNPAGILTRAQAAVILSRIVQDLRTP
ncbi:S8 family serine peptidase [Paenibacillus sp. PK3_47]|uniref:S8 family serine peptidase n=1 Tax=Paenibacillus sp. PK3_47 TaxID=2072642 RepID=UPI0023B12330|nr:S8 family serine peptidase [Paenibacillus sp. PK3_47]